MTDFGGQTRLDQLQPVLARLVAARAAWPRVREELAADRLIYLTAAIYMLIAGLLLSATPGDYSVSYFRYVPVWLPRTAFILLIFVLVRTLPAVLREKPEHPLAILIIRASRFVTPRAFAGFALIAVQIVVMGTFTSMKQALPDLAARVWGAPFVWDEALAYIDSSLFGGHDPWTLLTPFIARFHLLAAVEYLYTTGWILALALVPATVALSPSLQPIRVRFFLTYILCWALLGNLLAVLGMSAGPAFFGNITGDTTRFGSLVDLLAVNSGSNWSAYDIQRLLWDLYSRRLLWLGSGISAFPSLHMAMVTLWTIVGFQANRTLGFVGLAFLGLFQIASVALGWHYVIDGVASIAAVLLIWTVVGLTLGQVAHAVRRAGVAISISDQSESEPCR